MLQQKRFGLPCIEVKGGCFPMRLDFLLAQKWRGWQKKKATKIRSICLELASEFMQSTVQQ